MTTEEKARAYDEAFKRAKAVWRFSSNSAEIMRMEEIFPELKESEDEKIRKALIKGVECCKASGWTNFGNNVDIDVVLAWLKEQGKQKPACSEEDENRFQNIIACIGDCYNEKDAQDLIRWFKSLRHQPKPIWSKADIKMLQLIIDGYQNTEDFSKVDGVFVDWLKSLKDRMEGKED